AVPGASTFGSIVAAWISQSHLEEFAMTTKRISPLQSLLLVSITVLLLIAIVAVHQSAGGTELSGSLDAHIQANPTDEVSLPIRAAPTETPTSRVTEPPAPQEAFQVKPTVA